MISFAGFNMPVEYSGVKDEHITVRTKVGVFDISHMGEIFIKGPATFDFLQKVTSNDISRLYNGRIQYSCLPNGNGGIVDDLLVYKMDVDNYLLVVNAVNIYKDWDWLKEQNTKGTILVNKSDEISQLAVQGPDSTATLLKLTEVNLTNLKYYTFTIGKFAGIENVIISVTGYTGAGGYELYFRNEEAIPIWNAILDAGKEYGIKPIGLAARDTLRLEMGYCLYGNDIDDTTSPIEAGLGWITKFEENKQFIDRDFLMKQKNEGVSRKLVGFEMMERGIPRPHYNIFDGDNNPIGTVTSGTMSPMMNKGIGMGYVKSEMTKPGQEIWIEIRSKLLKAKVVTLPIYKQN